jgi:hypothetical protein
VWPEAVLLADPRKWLIDLDAHGHARAFPEYPWPAVALLDLPLRLGVPTALHYYAAVVLFMLAIDAVFAWFLWRAGGSRMNRGLWLWLAMFPALGPLVVTRYDILPAALAGGALLALAAARPATAGALASLGAGFKIWPAVGFAALLVPGERKSRARVLVGICSVLVALALASAAAAGWSRLWSPFTLQGQRGLQLEAFGALPLLWARYFNPDGGWAVRQENVLCKCHELYGPGVDVALQLAFPALLIAAVLVTVLYTRAFHAPAAARTSAVAALLTTVSLVAWLVTARVFSPQYMIWLAAPLAALGTLPGTPLARRDVALFVTAAVLTHLIYPLGYEAAVIERHPLQGIFLVIVTLRDALIVWLGARLALQAWRLT